MSTYSGKNVSRRQRSECVYPTRDGRPFGETDLHRAVMIALLEVLQRHYAGQRTYVSGNILLFYRRGERRRYVSPDVLVVLDHDPGNRDHYLLWAEGRPPNIVIEVTSKSTRREDLHKKFELYRDEIGVAEYVLFDPREEYLEPSLQGYRLCEGRYEPITLVDGRLPSIELGLSFERDGELLRVYDPAARSWLRTFHELEMLESQRRKDERRRRREAEEGRKVAEEGRLVAEEQTRRYQAELERLRALLKQEGAD